MAVMIGIDPHRGSHTAVAISSSEEPLGRLRVRTCVDQAGELVAWAAAWPECRWAVEGASGPGGPAGSAVRRGRGAGTGRAAEAGRLGAAARGR
jgi:hypothetical protein